MLGYLSSEIQVQSAVTNCIVAEAFYNVWNFFFGDASHKFVETPGKVPASIAICKDSLAAIDFVEYYERLLPYLAATPERRVITLQGDPTVKAPLFSVLLTPLLFNLVTKYCSASADKTS